MMSMTAVQWQPHLLLDDLPSSVLLTKSIIVQGTYRFAHKSHFTNFSQVEMPWGESDLDSGGGQLLGQGQEEFLAHIRVSCFCSRFWLQSPYASETEIT